MIVYAQRRVTGITDLEKRFVGPGYLDRNVLISNRLNVQGYALGIKLLDLVLYRSNIPFASTSSAAANLRPTHILPLLQFISTTLWKHLFGRPADALERSQDSKDEYMITDNDPMVNSYISVPKEMSQLNCAAYVAGIVEGVCEGSGFPARVSAHSVEDEEGQDRNQMWPGKTIFLVKFNEEVMEREELLSHNKG